MYGISGFVSVAKSETWHDRFARQTDSSPATGMPRVPDPRKAGAVRTWSEHLSAGKSRSRSSLSVVRSRLLSGRSARSRTLVGVEIVLETATPEGVRVVLPALVYAKVLEEHAAVADLELIDRTIRSPDERRPDPRPGRERFLRRERGLLVLAVVEFGEVPAIIVTVFSAIPQPS